MNLAITLLVAICIAAVIGTVLQQNLSYPQYESKFGSFWYHVFDSLGLYDVYGTAWFLGLVGFLLVSTSVCLYRNTPHILRDMRHFRLDAQEKSLRGFHHHSEWEAQAEPEAVLSRANAVLSAHGYRLRHREHEGRTVLAGMKGHWNRLGYILTHLAIVVICIGALLDGNIPLRISEQLGEIQVQPLDVPLAEVPPKGMLSPENPAFRGNASIPEGGSRDSAVLYLRNGFLLQKLPFRIELTDFRMEHYATGQPKSYESDVVIHDPDNPEPVKRTIAVNHPLVYKGYSIYQSSFNDGGSLLNLKAWSLDAPTLEPVDLEARVYQNLKMVTPRGPITIELNDFKLFNVQPAMEGSGKEFQNFGPSVVFTLRSAAAEPREYVNYMAPLVSKGRSFFVSGVRGSQAESYRYLYIPLDPKGGIDRFMRLRARLLDRARLLRAAAVQVDSLVGAGANVASKEELGNSIASITEMFVRGGMDAIMAQVEKAVPSTEREKALEYYILVLRNSIGAVYLDVLKEEGTAVEKGVGETDVRFFDDSMETMAVMGNYGSPMFVQLTGFDHLQASVLQITRAPGQMIVYLGFVMLMTGVFFMFYLHYRRVWVSIVPESNGSRVLFAGSGNRDRAEFGKEFDTLRALIEPPASKETNEDAAQASDKR